MSSFSRKIKNLEPSCPLYSKEYDDSYDYLIFEGHYLNGKRNGKGKEYNILNGKTFEGEYLNGKRN